jgi:NADPH:quinone reductase
MTDSATQLQLRSLISTDGRLELSLAEIPIPVPGVDEVLIRVEAAPLNPSDQGLLFGAADMSTAKSAGTERRPIVYAEVPAAARKSMTARLDQSLPVGNEGAGVVIGAGGAPAAQALLGRQVAVLAGAMYSQYRCAAASQCLVLPDHVPVADGASAFVNPLTVLGMVHTMRAENHRALVHTAAASNLGQMLIRLCAKDGIPLVNVVRSAAQEALLRGMGARHVVNTSSGQYVEELRDAMVATGATIAFDATGGGILASQILSAMEFAASRAATTYSRYGSTVHKQVYLYGGLDPRPTELIRDFGMAWGIGGWLVMGFLQKIGTAAFAELKQRVAGELQSTFASAYSREISLVEALQLDTLAAFGRRSTGQKYLINPNKTA